MKKVITAVIAAVLIVSNSPSIITTNPTVASAAIQKTYSGSDRRSTYSSGVNVQFKVEYMYTKKGGHKKLTAVTKTEAKVDSNGYSGILKTTYNIIGNTIHVRATGYVYSKKNANNKKYINTSVTFFV